MAPVLAGHRGRLAGALSLALVAMLIQVAMPAVIRQAVDRSLVARVSPLWPYVAGLLALGGARAGLTYLYRNGLFKLAWGIDTDLRVLLFDRVSSLDWTYFDRVASGQLISRANSDIRSVQLYLAFAPLVLMTVLQFVVAVAYMLTIDVGLTVVAVATLPAVYWFGVRLRDQTFPLSWISQSRQAEVAGVVDENIAGVRVVRSFAAEQQQVTEMARAATRLRWANIRTADSRSRLNPLIENLPRLSMAGVVGYGGWLVIQGRVTEGTLFAFTAYVTQLQVPFRTLGLFLMLGTRARASAQRIYEVLDEQPRVADRPGAVDLIDAVGRLSFEGVTFRYGGADGDRGAVLEDFTLEVPAGQTVALVGRTGSGKSTVGRLLGRFYDVEAGAVRIDGHDVRDLTQVSLRAHVAFAFDDPFLFSVPIRDNIAYSRPDADLAAVREAARDAQADGFIDALPQGYDTAVGERGYTLSGGQRQRVALARVLLANPPVLVLDDATSAIDAEVEALIHDALRRRLHRRTTVLVAHRLSTITLADRVVLLEGGRVVADGTHAELLAREPRYAAVLATVDDAEDPAGDVTNDPADQPVAG